MRKSIVVAAHGDDAPTRDALALGVRLAELLGADLVLAGVWASPVGAGDGMYEGTVRDEIARELARLRAVVPDAILVRTEIRGSTSVVRGLHRIAEEHRADVLVLGPSRLGPRARGFRGDVALGLVHDAPCAVAVAPEGYRDRGGDARDVAVAWDDSPEAGAALERAVALAQATGGTLRIVFVLESPYRYVDVAGPEMTTAAAWTASALDAGAEVVARAETLVAGRVPVVGEVRDGIAPEELAAVAEDCAIVVAGSRGHGSLARLVLGSTTAELLGRVTVPVFLVPRGVDGVAEAKA